MSLRRYLGEANKPVPQSEKADERQIANSAGGFTFQISNRTRIERFITLGTDGGTYYVSEQDLTKQNVEWLIEWIKTDANAISILSAAEISSSGRALRNDAAIFVLELVFQYGSNKLKATARELFPSIVRTSYHLFQSCDFAERMGGAWSASRQKAVRAWYTNKSADQLAFQAVKYRQRNGWTHRDVFRLAHPTGVDQNVGRFILGQETLGQNVPSIIGGFKLAQQAKDVKELLGVLDTFPNLPWEAIPTQFHKEPDVWKKLFYNGQLSGQALVRNITRLSRIGAFNDMVFAADYAAKLTDEEMIRRTRLHPFNYLNALLVHEHGQIWRNMDPFSKRPKTGLYSDSSGVLRVKDWQSVPVILDALNAGFYISFEHVQPSGKRMSINLDVSGSMKSPASGLDMSCAQAGAAMAMSVARTEPYYQVNGFSDGTTGRVMSYRTYNKRVLADLGISPGMNLTQVLKKTADHNFGLTDCALPMVVARKDKIEVDTFVIVTDNETWHGDIHPHVALEQYRQAMGRDAKLVVVAMTATPFTIANPTDAGMLDVVGMDASVPKLISEFAKSGF